MAEAGELGKPQLLLRHAPFLTGGKSLPKNFLETRIRFACERTVKILDDSPAVHNILQKLGSDESRIHVRSAMEMTSSCLGIDCSVIHLRVLVR